MLLGRILSTDAAVGLFKKETVQVPVCRGSGRGMPDGDDIVWILARSREHQSRLHSGELPWLQDIVLTSYLSSKARPTAHAAKNDLKTPVAE